MKRNITNCITTLPAKVKWLLVIFSNISQRFLTQLTDNRCLCLNESKMLEICVKFSGIMKKINVLLNI